MAEHKHADVFRAIADGVSPGEFEIPWGYKKEWRSLGELYSDLFSEDLEIRRRPRTRVINGFTVPAPETVAPSSGDIYYFPVLHVDGLCAADRWDDTATDMGLLARGLLFLTKEDAIANAKAMLGIDPKAPEQ